MSADDGLEPLPASLARTWGNTETMEERMMEGSVQGSTSHEETPGLEGAQKAIDEILKREVAAGVIGKHDRRRLRFCMGAAIYKALMLQQGPTCSRCGNSWAARADAERVIRALIDQLQPDSPYDQGEAVTAANHWIRQFGGSDV